MASRHVMRGVCRSRESPVCFKPSGVASPFFSLNFGIRIQKPDVETILSRMA